jgi:hypothetical protein
VVKPTLVRGFDYKAVQWRDRQPILASPPLAADVAPEVRLPAEAPPDAVSVA